jgi:hypothetical protein
MRRFLIICWLLLAMTPLILGLGGCSSEPATVRGVVSQALDPNKPLDDPANAGQGIAQAEVTFSILEKVRGVKDIDVYNKGPVIYSAITDATGAFSLPVASGNYVIDVWVNGQRMGGRQIEVKGGQTIEANLNVPATP